MNDARLSLEARHRNFVEVIMMRASIDIPEDWVERCAFAGFVPAVFHFQPPEWCCSTRIPSIGSKFTEEPHRTNTLTMRRSRRCSRGEDVMLVCAGYMNRGPVLRAPGDDYNIPACHRERQGVLYLVSARGIAQPYIQSATSK